MTKKRRRYTPEQKAEAVKLDYREHPEGMEDELQDSLPYLENWHIFGD